MSDINWGLYNIPSYDMTDLRKSRELAYNEQADVAEQFEKALRERKEKAEEQANLQNWLSAIGGGNGAGQLGSGIAGILAAM